MLFEENKMSDEANQNLPEIETAVSIETEVVLETSDAPIEVNHKEGTIKVAGVVTLHPMTIAESLLHFGWAFLSKRRH